MSRLEFAAKLALTKSAKTIRVLTGTATHEEKRLRDMHQEQRALEKSLAPQCRADFIKQAGILPEQFLRIVTQGLPQLLHADIRYEIENTSFFTVVYEGLGYKGDFSISFQENIFEGGTVQNLFAKRGTGKQMFARHGIAALYLGFSRVNGNASLEMGAHMWARAGAYIKPADIPRTSRVLERRLAEIANDLAPDVHAHAAQLVKLGHRTDLRKIAELDTVLPDIAPVWEQMHNHEISFPKSYQYYRDHKVVRGNDMTLGHFLLLGLSYDLYIDLRNPALMSRLEKFTGVPVRERVSIIREKYPRAITRPSKPWLVMR